MCGIGGYVHRDPATASPGRVPRLLAALRARGPDDEGVALIDRPGGRATLCRAERTAPPNGRLPSVRDARVPHDVALVNTRYAVVDLSAGGHQPFATPDRGVIAVFNGEIYNYRELRARLETEGHTFRTASDTEVLVVGYRAWRDRVWERLNGFWAVALYDADDRAVVLSRDRLGVAPLYVRETGGALHFASNIAALLDAPPARGDLDDDAVTGFVESELKDIDEATCFRDVRAFPPGAAARVPLGEASLGGKPRAFWRVPKDTWSTADVTFDDAASRFRDLFFDAVRLRLRADVPVVCELSGGLDSSSIVAAAAAERPDLVTYTLVVPEENEEPFARTMRSRYRLDYRTLTRPEAAFPEHAEGFARIMEEPYHAPNIFTHYAMRRRMKADGVAVVLSGSGGDEALAGYEWDFWPAARRELWRTGHRMDAVLCHAAMRFGTPARAWETVTSLARALRGRTATAPPVRPPTRAERLQAAYGRLGFAAQRRFHLTVGLQPYYLRSNDHFTMQLPLEHRLPFLDYRLVELACRLPPAYLFRRGWTKYVLRKAMDGYLPREIAWRREKMGFPFPLRAFLQREAPRLAPYADAAAREGFARLPYGGYERERAANPLRAWRLCSTGIWLRAMVGAAS